MRPSNSPSPSWRRFDRSLAPIPLALLALYAGACSSKSESARSERVEISAVEAAITARENTTRALRGLSSSAAFLSESRSVAEAMASLAGTTTECTGSAAVCPAGTTCDTPVETCETKPAVTVEDLDAAHDDLDAFIDALETKLQDEVFIDANLESDDGTNAVYKIPAAVFCDPSDDSDVAPSVDPQAEPVPAEPVPSEPDPECLNRYETYAPRLRLSSPGGQDVDVDVLLTDELRNVASFQLYTDRIGVSIDLGEAFAVAQTTGEDLGSVAELDGTVQLELVRNAEKDYSLRYNVLDDLRMKMDNEGTGEFVTIEEAAQSPIFELRLDARDGKGSLTGTYNLGAVRVSGPLNAFREMFDSESADAESTPIANTDPTPEKVYTGTIDALLAGLEGSLTYTGNTDTLLFSGIGLGDATSFIKFNGSSILDLDLNKNAGRHFDLLFDGTGDHPKLTFSPTFDLSLSTKFQLLADQITDIPSELLDNAYHFWFDGTDPTVQVEDDQVRVLSGTLHLESSSAPEDAITVESGMCLIDPNAEGDSTDAPDTDPAAPVPTDTGSTDAGSTDPTPTDPAPTDAAAPEPAPEESSAFGGLVSGACN